VKESEATHSITFRHSTVYPDSTAVIEEGGFGRNLPSLNSAGSWQEVVRHALSIQSRLKSMPLHYNNNKNDNNNNNNNNNMAVIIIIYLQSLAGDDRVLNATVAHALSIQPCIKYMFQHLT